MYTVSLHNLIEELNMKSLAISFKTSRLFYLILLFLLGLIIIAATGCDAGSNSDGDARAADDAKQQSETPAPL